MTHGARHFARAVLAFVALVLAGECFCRYVIGLGDPPLSVADPQIEYMFKPGTYHRFGKRVSINPYHMRSDDFTPARGATNELRVLVIGDSVANGGALVDQTEVASELLRDKLHRLLGRPVVTGNASAGSWGPPNEAAYVRRFGLYDADFVVLVFNSGDADDVPSGNPVVGVDPDHPGERPVSALLELVTRYGPRYLPFLAPPPSLDTPTNEVQAHAWCEASEKWLIAEARRRGARILVVLHYQRDEVGKPEPPGLRLLRQWAEAAGAPVLSMDRPYADSPARNALFWNPGPMHLTAQGHQVMADTLARWIEDDLAGRH